MVLVTYYAESGGRKLAWPTVWLQVRLRRERRPDSLFGAHQEHDPEKRGEHLLWGVPFSHTLSLTHPHTHTHTHTYSHSHSITHSLAHTLTHMLWGAAMSFFFFFFTLATGPRRSLIHAESGRNWNHCT